MQAYSGEEVGTDPNRPRNCSVITVIWPKRQMPGSLRPCARRLGRHLEVIKEERVFQAEKWLCRALWWESFWLSIRYWGTKRKCSELEYSRPDEAAGQVPWTLPKTLSSQDSQEALKDLRQRERVMRADSYFEKRTRGRPEGRTGGGESGCVEIG